MVQLYDPPMVWRAPHPRTLSVESLRGSQLGVSAASGHDPKILTSPTSPKSGSAPGRPATSHAIHRSTSHRSAGWTELFSDLVFVSLIAELTHSVVGEFSPAGSHQRLLYGNDAVNYAEDHPMELPFGWSSTKVNVIAVLMMGSMAWNNWTLDCAATSRFTGGADVLGRLLNCGYMFCLIIFAAAAGQNFDDWARVCAAHGGATTVSLLKYGRGFLSDPVNSRPLLKILVPFSIEIALFFFVGLYLKHPTTQKLEHCIIVAFSALVYRVVIFAYNWVFGGKQGKQGEYYDMATQVDTHYVIERFGLITIILIGETVISLVSGVKNQSADVLQPLGWGFAVVYANWWVYFDNLHNSVVSFHARSFLLSFTHSLLMLSNIFLASGLTLIFSGDGVNGVNSKIPTKVVVMTSVAYAATVLGHSLVRILTVWPTQAIRKEPKRFFYRCLNVVCLVVFIAAIPFWPTYKGQWMSYDLLRVYGLVGVYRMIHDAVVQQGDYKPLEKIWREMGMNEVETLLQTKDSVGQTACQQMDGALNGALNGAFGEGVYRILAKVGRFQDSESLVNETNFFRHSSLSAGGLGIDVDELRDPLVSSTED